MNIEGLPTFGTELYMMTPDNKQMKRVGVVTQMEISGGCECKHAEITCTINPLEPKIVHIDEQKPIVSATGINLLGASTFLYNTTYEATIKGIWNKEEEEKDMKLESILKIYRGDEEEKYAEERFKKIDELKKNDKVYTAFTKILDEAEQKLKELYESNRNCFDFDEDCDAYIGTDLELTDYMCSQRQDIMNDYYEKCKKLDDRMMKIQAKIDLVKETSNDYNEIKNILIKNGILENENCAKKPCKRGRKPKQKIEENK